MVVEVAQHDDVLLALRDEALVDLRDALSAHGRFFWGIVGRAPRADIRRAAMRIQLRGHSELVTDLRDHLRRAGCIAVQTDPETLEVAVPDAPSRGQERREVRAYLAAWTAARGVDVHLED